MRLQIRSGLSFEGDIREGGQAKQTGRMAKRSQPSPMHQVALYGLTAHGLYSVHELLRHCNMDHRVKPGGDEG